MVPSGSIGEVFTAFLRLVFTIFGGPVAHLGYFNRELVLRRGWISVASYGCFAQHALVLMP
jgi:chromate transporter